MISLFKIFLITRGEIYGTARNLLVAARLNVVPKNGNKYRPIRIEYAVCRLFGAVASDIARKIVGPGLQPIQTGGGLRCGVEFGARMADLAYRFEDTIIAVDIANAFNTVRYGPIFSAIVDRYSPIDRFYRWKYGTSIAFIVPLGLLWLGLRVLLSPHQHPGYCCGERGMNRRQARDGLEGR